MVPPYAESAPMRAAPHATAFVAVLVLRGVLAGGGTDVEATLSQDCGAGGRRCDGWRARSAKRGLCPADTTEERNEAAHSDSDGRNDRSGHELPRPRLLRGRFQSALQRLAASSRAS